MSFLQLSLCKACGGSIIWAQTSKGVKVPVDATPIDTGTVRLEPTLSGETPLAIILTHAAPPGTTLYQNHFLSCPHRATFKKPKARRRA